MNSRQRLDATLNHRQPDRVCVDFGSTFITGMHVSIVDRLRKAVLGDNSYKVKVCEPYQMLGDVDDELRDALGIDVLNPVQCSAAEMDPLALKKTFGNDVVFCGGGVDTQKTLAFSAPDKVYHEVRERIDIFNDGSGFVFNAIHNIQGNVPMENVQAMFKAIDDSR